MYSSSNSSLTFVFILVQSATFVLWWYQFLLKDANIFKHSFISYAKQKMVRTMARAMDCKSPGYKFESYSYLYL